MMSLYVVVVAALLIAAAPFQSTFGFVVVRPTFGSNTSNRATISARSAPSKGTTTELYLFGGGGKDKAAGGGGGGGPNMMDQLAMFKKAQEIATKKKKLDEELTKETFVGTSSDGSNVKVSMKYVPVQNPMDPNPEYESIQFTFDDGYYNNVSTDDLAQDIQDAIMNGIENTNKMVAEKYKALESDLREALGGAIPGLK
jgi:hypothetical protein